MKTLTGDSEINGSFRAQEDLGLVINGVLDVIFAFAMTLERKGVMERCELATMFRFVSDQATKQSGRTKRTLIAEMMIEAFEMPVAGDQVRERWQVVDGGKPGDAAPGADDDNLPPAA